MSFSITTPAPGRLQSTASPVGPRHRLTHFEAPPSSRPRRVVPRLERIALPAGFNSRSLECAAAPLQRQSSTPVPFRAPRRRRLSLPVLDRFSAASLDILRSIAPAAPSPLDQESSSLGTYGRTPFDTSSLRGAASDRSGTRFVTVGLGAGITHSTISDLAHQLLPQPTAALPRSWSISTHAGCSTAPSFTSCVEKFGRRTHHPRGSPRASAGVFPLALSIAPFPLAAALASPFLPHFSPYSFLPNARRPPVSPPRCASTIFHALGIEAFA